MNTEINTIIELADSLDERGLVVEAAIIDNFLKVAAKEDVHKCGLKQASIDLHQELLADYKKAAEDYAKEYKKVMNSSNETDSPNHGKLREILRGQSHNGNSICLHEIFLSDTVDNKPYSLEKAEFAAELIDKYFAGGAKAMLKEIRRAALTTRNGWVMLSFCTKDKSLYVNTCDLHDIGVSISSIVVLAIDFWEHAYINDFGTDKPAYLDWYFSRLNWRDIGKRIKSAQSIK